MDDQAMAEPAWCDPGGSAGDHPGMASRRLQNLLALEIAKHRAARIDRGLRDLIRRINWENPRWGASGSMARFLCLALGWTNRRSRNILRDLRSRSSPSWK